MIPKQNNKPGIQKITSFKQYFDQKKQSSANTSNIDNKNENIPKINNDEDNHSYNVDSISGNNDSM